MSEEQKKIANMDIVDDTSAEFNAWLEQSMAWIPYNKVCDLIDDNFSHSNINDIMESHKETMMQVIIEAPNVVFIFIDESCVILTAEEHKTQVSCAKWAKVNIEAIADKALMAMPAISRAIN